MILSLPVVGNLQVFSKKKKIELSMLCQRYGYLNQPRQDADFEMLRGDMHIKQSKQAQS
jgi:hypothetical protein